MIRLLISFVCLIVIVAVPLMALENVCTTPHQFLLYTPVLSQQPEETALNLEMRLTDTTAATNYVSLQLQQRIAWWAANRFQTPVVTLSHNTSLASLIGAIKEIQENLSHGYALEIDLTTDSGIAPLSYTHLTAQEALWHTNAVIAIPVITNVEVTEVSAPVAANDGDAPPVSADVTTDIATDVTTDVNVDTVDGVEAPQYSGVDSTSDATSDPVPAITEEPHTENIDILAVDASNDVIDPSANVDATSDLTNLTDVTSDVEPPIATPPKFTVTFTIDIYFFDSASRYSQTILPFSAQVHVDVSGGVEQDGSNFEFGDLLDATLRTANVGTVGSNVIFVDNDLIFISRNDDVYINVGDELVYSGAHSDAPVREDCPPNSKKNGLIKVRAVASSYLLAQLLTPSITFESNDRVVHNGKIISLEPYVNLLIPLANNPLMITTGLRIYPIPYFFLLRPFAAFEVGFQTESGIVFFPSQLYAGLELNWYIGSILVSPRIAAGISAGVGITSPPFFFSHVGVAGGVNTSIWLTHAVAVSIDIGYAHWFNIYNNLRIGSGSVSILSGSGYGGITTGAGVRIKL